MGIWRTKNVRTASIGGGSPFSLIGGASSWQQKAKYFDCNNSLLGYSLDMVASVASSANIFLIAGGKELTDDISKSKLDSFTNRYGQSFQDIIFSAVRLLALFGEFDLVKIDDDFGEDYVVLSTFQRDSQSGDTIKYRLTENSQDFLTVAKDDVVRIVNSKTGTIWEAYSTVERILPMLEIYDNLLNQLKTIAHSNTIFPKIGWFGPDDGLWRNNSDNSFDDAGLNNSVPPVIADAVQLSKQMMAGDKFAPFYPMMSDVKPEAIDLTTSIDATILDTLNFLQQQIAVGLNIPARLLNGDSGNHWSDWLLDGQLKQFAVEPLLRIALKGLAPVAKDIGNAQRFGYNFVGKSSLDASQALDAYSLGIVGSDFVRDAIGATDADKPTEEDIVQLKLFGGNNTGKKVMPDG